MACSKCRILTTSKVPSSKLRITRPRRHPSGRDWGGRIHAGRLSTWSQECTGANSGTESCTSKRRVTCFMPSKGRHASRRNVVKEMASSIEAACFMPQQSRFDKRQTTYDIGESFCYCRRAASNSVLSPGPIASLELLPAGTRFAEARHLRRSSSAA